MVEGERWWWLRNTLLKSVAVGRLGGGGVSAESRGRRGGDARVGAWSGRAGNAVIVVVDTLAYDSFFQSKRTHDLRTTN